MAIEHVVSVLMALSPLLVAAYLARTDRHDESKGEIR